MDLMPEQEENVTGELDSIEGSKVEVSRFFT